MINATALCKTYGTRELVVHALDNVSLEIKEGEMVSIMGKSGSGKTTLMRQLGLIDRPTSGELSIDGANTSKLSDSSRAAKRLETIGFVFQDFALLPELTALENVLLPGLMLTGNFVAARDRAKALLSEVGLEKLGNHLPEALSGGEQQRAAIARALINQPKYLLADEPTTNLDTASAKKVLETLRELNQKHKVTVVLVSHDPDDKQYVDRIVYLKDGKATEPYL